MYIFAAISLFTATREPLMLTIKLPLFFVITVTREPGMNPSFSKNRRISSLPPTFLIKFTSPSFANANDIIYSPSFPLVKANEYIIQEKQDIFNGFDDDLSDLGENLSEWGKPLP
jgi:hypothetical protein